MLTVEWNTLPLPHQISTPVVTLFFYNSKWSTPNFVRGCDLWGPITLYLYYDRHCHSLAMYHSYNAIDDVNSSSMISQNKDLVYEKWKHKVLKSTLTDILRQQYISIIIIKISVSGFHPFHLSICLTCDSSSKLSFGSQQWFNPMAAVLPLAIMVSIGSRVHSKAGSRPQSSQPAITWDIFTYLSREFQGLA